MTAAIVLLSMYAYVLTGYVIYKATSAAGCPRWWCCWREHLFCWGPWFIPLVLIAGDASIRGLRFGIPALLRRLLAPRLPVPPSGS
jgi:hypothetical protein